MRQKKEINIRVGNNIQLAREAAKYTQEELSELLDITPNHLSAIERGASGATLEMLEKLCKLFCLSSDSLLFGQDNSDRFVEEIASQLGSIRPEYRPQTRKLLSALLAIIAIHESDK